MRSRFDSCCGPHHGAYRKLIYYQPKGDHYQERKWSQWDYGPFKKGSSAGKPVSRYCYTLSKHELREIEQGLYGCSFCGNLCTDDAYRNASNCSDVRRDRGNTEEREKPNAPCCCT